MKYQIEKISKRIKIEKAISNTIKTLVIIFLILLLVINLMMLYQTNTNPEGIPNIYNISIFNIVSESMKPTIQKNDLIIIQKTPKEEISIGDIITYKKSDNTVVTHRVVRINKDENNKEIQYITKGDNNQIEDAEAIKYEQIYGKVVFKIDRMGMFVEVLQKGNGIFSIIIIIIIFIILKNSNDKKKEERKRIREKYELKKKRDEYNKNNK